MRVAAGGVGSSGGSSGAPDDAEYLVRTADSGLSAERVVTDTPSVVADWGTAGQVKLNVQFGTSAGEACEGIDPRLSDARTPTAHASSHLGGSDQVVSEVRTAGLGLQLDSRGLLDLSAVAASAAWHPASCMATGATLSQVGMAASAALGSASAAGHAIRMTGTAGTGRRLDTRTMTRDGGFVVAIRFRLPSSIGARRVWIGLHGTSPTDSDTAAGEFVGWLYSSVRGDAGPRPVSNDGTQTDGTAMTAFVADHWYLAVMYQYRGGSTVYLELHDLTAGTVDTDTITTDLPATTTPLAWVFASFNQGVNKSTDFSHCLIYVDQA